RPNTTGAEIFPCLIALLNAFAISILPSLSAYNIRACEPTTSLFFWASFIHLILSAICCFISLGAFLLRDSSTLAASLSVTARSLGLHEVQAQRKGPNP